MTKDIIDLFNEFQRQEDESGGDEVDNDSSDHDQVIAAEFFAQALQRDSYKTGDDHCDQYGVVKGKVSYTLLLKLSSYALARRQAGEKGHNQWSNQTGKSKLPLGSISLPSQED